MGDAVGCAIAGRHVPDGYHHLDRMPEACARHGTEIACCATGMDARGLRDDLLTPSAHRGSLDQLADGTLWADQAITF